MAAAEIAGFNDTWAVAGTTVRIRPIRPDDREREAAFVRGLSPASRYYRFHAALRELTPELLERFTHNSYPDYLGLVAVIDASAGEEQIGVARYARRPGSDAAEIAVVVADAWQGRGVATRLLTNLRSLARAAGINQLKASVLRENGRMLALVHKLGFVVERDPDADHRTSTLGKHIPQSD